ncbi:MAG TPA: YciI family protein [Acidimicrobiia bacterium]|jgi:hypothetical protein
MKYALLIYSPEPTEPPSEEEIGEVMMAYNAFSQAVRDKGAYIGGEALEDSTTASTVRVRDGQVLTSDGPFAETKEVLGGFYLLDCANLDEALSWAAQIPGAKNGSIEVRPVWEVPAQG